MLVQRVGEENGTSKVRWPCEESHIGIFGRASVVSSIICHLEKRYLENIVKVPAIGRLQGPNRERGPGTCNCSLLVPPKDIDADVMTPVPRAGINDACGRNTAVHNAVM